MSITETTTSNHSKIRSLNHGLFSLAVMGLLLIMVTVTVLSGFLFALPSTNVLQPGYLAASPSLLPPGALYRLCLSSRIELPFSNSLQVLLPFGTTALHSER
jgi:hypothetical protein